MLPTPEDLVRHHAAQGFDTLGTWEEANKCEVLEPFSAVSVPHHWNQVPGADQRFDDWTWHADRVLTLSGNEPSAEGKWSTRMDFGDQLGGFPIPVQDHPEYDMEPGPHKAIIPGASPWRLLFSNSAEFMSGTRLYPGGGDGQFYWMIHETALDAHEFGHVRLPYQQT